MLHLIKELWTKCNKTTVILGIIETVIIVVLVVMLAFRSPAPQIKTQDNEKQIRERDTILQNKFDIIVKEKLLLQHQNDSLIDLKTNIQIITKTKIQYEKSAPIDTTTRFVHSELGKITI